MLEKTIQKNGYFFRQYPLVANSEIIENKPKGKTIRRAIGKRNNTIVVVESRSRESFFDFSQALVDIGISDAIYLVGGNSFGWYKGKDNAISTFGSTEKDITTNMTYIVWRE